MVFVGGSAVCKCGAGVILAGYGGIKIEADVCKSRAVIALLSGDAFT